MIPAVVFQASTANSNPPSLLGREQRPMNTSRDDEHGAESHRVPWFGREIMGCATLVGTPFIGVTFVIMLFATDAPISVSITVSAMIGMIAVTAVLLLCLRDRARARRSLARVRRRCSAREDVPDDWFREAFPNVEPRILLETRAACAKFLGVPARKLHPTDSLRGDLGFDCLSPGLLFFVLSRLLESIPQSPRAPIVGIDERHLVTIGDLAAEMQRVVESVSNDGGPCSPNAGA